MTTAISATGFSVEWRDKDGNFKGYLHPYLSRKPTWEWNRKGGCGLCSLTLKQGYRDLVFDARDDIQIRIKSGSTSKLVYRGYVADVTPTLQNDQTVVIRVRGYFDLLKKIVAHDSGDLLTYSTQQISAIVTDLIDTFVTAATPITKGTIDSSSFEVDSIQFLQPIETALQTLSDLAGDAEYGVDEDLVFFWRSESSVITHRFFVGTDIKKMDRKVNYDNLVNKIYLVGGEVAGSKYKRTAENTDSQTLYYLSEKIENNGSIISDSTADEFLGSLLRQKSAPVLSIRAEIPNTTKRLEDTVPIGLVTFYDPQHDKSIAGDLVGDIIGEEADGGSDITVGLAADGGSDVYVGGQYSAQVNRISYTPSNTPGRVDMVIEFGETVLETAAKLKRLELALSNLNQY